MTRPDDRAIADHVAELAKSAYPWPDGPYKMIRIGCTGRGTHRVEKFGTARVWPDGTVDLRLRKGVDTNGGMPFQVRLEEGIHADPPHWPHTALRCSRCRRAPRFQHETIRTGLTALAAAGRNQLDLSVLPF